MQYEEVMRRLAKLADPVVQQGMARAGITPEKGFGVTLPRLRSLAREVGTDHELALQLWAAGYRETRILASMVDDPGQVTEEQMERWASDFDYWEICDQVCLNLFIRTPHARKKIFEWAQRDEVFIKRAAFAMIAFMASKGRVADDSFFEPFIPLFLAASTDDRPMVKKAVSWALRKIGKRSVDMNFKACEVARMIQALDTKSARWIASDVLRELTSDTTRERLKR